MWSYSQRQYANRREGSLLQKPSLPCLRLSVPGWTVNLLAFLFALTAALSSASPSPSSPPPRLLLVLLVHSLILSQPLSVIPVSDGPDEHHHKGKREHGRNREFLSIGLTAALCEERETSGLFEDRLQAGPAEETGGLPGVMEETGPWALGHAR